MKSKLLVTSFASLALMSGCASTSSYTHQPLELMTDHVSTYDETKSFALNVAEMTGKTYGLRDVSVPEDAQHRIGGGELGLAFTAGALGNGLISLTGTSLIYGNAISARNWRPMYAFTDIQYPYKGESDLNSEVESLMDSKFRRAFNAERFADTEYVGLAHTTRNHASNYNVFFSGARCDALIAAHGGSTGIPASFGERGVFGPIEFTKPTCLIPFRVSLTGRAKTKGEERVVAVMEQLAAYSLVSDLALSLDGYSVVPDTYLDLDGTRYSHQMPFVVHDGYLHVFSKDYAPRKLN